MGKTGMGNQFMVDFFNRLPLIAACTIRSHRRSGHRFWQQSVLTASLVSLIGISSPPAIVRSATPNDTPADLKALLSQVDKAASNKDMPAVMQFYSSNFRQADGLTRQTLEQALKQLWNDFSTLNYQTEVQSWKREGNGYLVETVTTITGDQKNSDRTWNLTSTLRARQRIENQQLVQQEVLSEKSQLTSGKNPPKVLIESPEQVKPGQEFSFDAIVQEPLGDDILLGAAIEEPVQASGLLKPTTVELEVLPAGGLFKVGKAPQKAESRWLSAVLVRFDGMTMVTQRLRVSP